MQSDNQILEQARALVKQKQLSVTVVVPSYGEGNGIVETLMSVWEGMVLLGLDDASIFLSDSSPDDATVDAARQWASSVSCQLVVVPAPSLAHLIVTLCGTEDTDVVVGVAAPDPSASQFRYRAGRFQLDVVGRLVRSAAPTMRAEGALWGAHRRFYEQWRFPIGSGSIADDVELARGVQACGFRGTTAADALVYKKPPGSVRDFCLQTRRSYYAISGDGVVRSYGAKWRAFAAEATRDPVGAGLYGVYRTVAAVSARRWAESANSETWEPSLTTKRRPRE
jgi:hypothetical protein